MVVAIDHWHATATDVAVHGEEIAVGACSVVASNTPVHAHSDPALDENGCPQEVACGI
jgi:hypothetical protein